MLDLAMGYQRKFGIKDGRFILSACDKVLEYHPNNINALLFKAETKMTIWKQDNAASKEQKQKEFEEIQNLYTQMDIPVKLTPCSGDIDPLPGHNSKNTDD